VSNDLSGVVERAIKDGDADRVRDLVLPLKETERRTLAKHFRESFERVDWNWQNRFEPQRIAGRVAWAATATARQLTTNAWALQAPSSFEIEPRIADVILARGSRFVGDFTRMALQSEWARPWSLVRRAVREGLIERPEGEGYVRAMVHGVAAGREDHGRLESVYDGLLADPALLDEDVWLVFEHEVGSELANSAVWSYSGGQYSGLGENRWIYALTRLADDGRLDRQRLLDASLDALMRDFRPSTLTWYAQLHEALEPTHDERAARLDRYLALVTSPAAPTLKAGLAALKALGESVPSDDLARASTAALVQPQKTHAVAMLRQLEAAVKRDEKARPALLAAAAEALAHEKPDVQERALKLLERYEQDAPRAELLAYIDVVTPMLRSRLERLTGLETDREIAAPPLEELTGPAAVAVRNGRWPDPRMPELRPTDEPLAQVESVDELIELTSALLEGQGSGDDAERFLDGVSRLCDQRPRGFKARTRSLRERAQPPWLAFPDATSGYHLISIVVAAWVSGTRPVSPARPTIGGFLVGRAVEVAVRARKRAARPLVSFPTHERGWLDPDALAARSQPKNRLFKRTPDAADLRVGGLRALSGPAVGLMPELTIGRRRWGGDPPRRVGVQITSMPPGLASMREVVDSLRWMGRDEVDWYVGDPSFPVEDALGAKWLMTLLPAFPEIQFARALTAIVDFVDVNPYRHPEVVLEWMLDPTVPLRDPAWTAVGAALVAKSADLRRAATDVVVATIKDGRFDPERLGHGIAWLCGNGFGTLTRIEAPLRDAARVSPLHAVQILRAIEAFLVGCPSEQKHLHVPLSLALDLAAGAGITLDSEPARLVAERIAESASRSSKLGKAAQGLLGLERDEAARGAILRLAASAAS
jgi:hypothetical protein